MLRDAQIPILLWLPAALVFHLLSGGGAIQGAKKMEQLANERAQILQFSENVRDEVRAMVRGQELSFEMDEVLPPEEEAKPPEEDTAKEDDEAPTEEAPVEPPKPEAPPKVALPKPPKIEPPPEPPKPVELPKPPEQAKAEPPKVADEKKPDAEKKANPQELVLPKPDGRIAIQNDPSLDPNQEDNPNAPRIADNANKVDEESMARFRSYDQNTSKPTGGGKPEPTPVQEPGNAAEDKPGFSTEVPGEEAPHAGSETGPTQPEKDPVARSPQGSNDVQLEQPGVTEQKEVKPIEEGHGPSGAEVVASPDGSWINPDGDGDDKPKQKGRKGKKGVKGRKAIKGVPNPAQLPQKYSINAYGLMDALGQEELRDEQERAKNTRIAKHRGKFKANEFQEKYRAAIENYDPSVKPGNQTSLNAARVPFAAYINKMHNAIHPIFADGFLGSLQSLDASDPLANGKLITHLELVLDGRTGKLIRSGIVKTSGVTAFDVAALKSVEQAGPFGQPPEVIVSGDGRVYVHWEFYRDPYYACTSKFARPYKIKGGAKSPNETEPTPQPPSGQEERTAEGAPLRPEKKTE
jgi:hypothetical protein